MREIIIDKSIQKKRLVFKLNTELVFDYIMAYFMTFFLPAATIIFILSRPVYDLQDPSTVPYIIFIVIDIWLIISYFLMNKLVTVKGTTLIDNKKMITELLINKYPKFEFISTDETNLILLGRKVEDWNRGKLITVILEESNIYINILSTYRGGGFSAFNGLANYLKSKSIAKAFELALN